MSSSIPISFAVPWTPTLRGKRILPCPLVKSLVAKKAVPLDYMPNDAPWALSSLEDAMYGVSEEGKAALEEGVVALWRFKVVEEGGGECKMWQDQVEAWLVRSSFGSISGAG